MPEKLRRFTDAHRRTINKIASDSPEVSGFIDSPEVSGFDSPEVRVCWISPPPSLPQTDPLSWAFFVLLFSTPLCSSNVWPTELILGFSCFTIIAFHPPSPSFRLFGSWLVPLRQYSSKFTSFYALSPSSLQAHSSRSSSTGSVWTSTTNERISKRCCIRLTTDATSPWGSQSDANTSASGAFRGLLPPPAHTFRLFNQQRLIWDLYISEMSITPPPQIFQDSFHQIRHRRKEALQVRCLFFLLLLFFLTM